MHQNYYFLKHLAEELNAKLAGHLLKSCFSQNKDELILGFTNSKTDYYIKADLSHQQGILSFAGDFKRANKNSIDLFTELIDCLVKKIRVNRNERSFQISFAQGQNLIFKLFGRQSNILLFTANEYPKLFKTQKAKDETLTLKGFNRTIDQTQENFIKNNGDLRLLFPTFGQILSDYLSTLGFLEKNIADQWIMVEQLLVELADSRFYLITYKDKLHLSLVKMGETIAKFDSAIETINAFYSRYVKFKVLEKEKNLISRQLEQKITRTGNYIIKAKSKLRELSTKRNDQVADVIMANLHMIVPRTDKIELFDFYNNETISVKLNPKLSAQKNAEKFYNKNKNQGIEIKKIKESLSSKTQELVKSELLLQQVKEFENIKQLRAQFKVKDFKSQPTKELPYHQFEIDYFTVLVGKNAKSNDRLTLQYANKDDMWFHARDVAGSHVVLKYQSEENFPSNVIEKVAQLAAWYSKGKHFPLCPVIYTLKKFVRKPKGFAAGKVKLDREEVILVEPKNLTRE